MFGPSKRLTAKNRMFRRAIVVRSEAEHSSRPATALSTRKSPETPSWNNLGTKQLRLSRPPTQVVQQSHLNTRSLPITTSSLHPSTTRQAPPPCLSSASPRWVSAPAPPQAVDTASRQPRGRQRRRHQDAVDRGSVFSTRPEAEDLVGRLSSEQGARLVCFESEKDEKVPALAVAGALTLQSWRQWSQVWVGMGLQVMVHPR